MILIKNGRVVDPVTGVDEVMDVLIDGAHIEEVGHNLSAASYGIFKNFEARGEAFAELVREGV